jgi:hypothetical protein
MFHYASFFVILFSILFFQSTSAQKKAKVVVEKPVISVFYDGGNGELEYPWKANTDENYFVVWSKVDSKGGRFGSVGGVINEKTKITFLNEEYKGFRGEGVRILELMSCKTVFVTGKFRKEGVGEGSKIYCEELSIAVVEYK